MKLGGAFVALGLAAIALAAPAVVGIAMLVGALWLWIRS